MTSDQPNEVAPAPDTPDLETMIEALPAEMQVRMRERMRQRMTMMYQQMDPATREEMLKHVAIARESQAGAPAAGAVAYDFDLRRLDGQGRTRLSDSRGRPVGLIFGSYT